MIRALRQEDLDEVMHIWLTSNLEAHPFIETSYWVHHFEAVKEAIATAEVYVREEENAIIAFIGVIDMYIAGLFVNKASRGKGIGTELLDFLKAKKNTLVLNVYVNNIAAKNFYINNGFEIVEEQTEPETKESEYTMKWKKGI